MGKIQKASGTAVKAGAGMGGADMGGAAGVETEGARLRVKDQGSGKFELSSTCPVWDLRPRVVPELDSACALCTMSNASQVLVSAK